ncbi:MAG: hypothetical protein WCI05_18090 [Myxococcales bacterium]
MTISLGFIAMFKGRWYAFDVASLPTSIAQATVLPVLLSAFSRSVSSGLIHEYRRTLVRALVVVCGLLVLMSVVLFAVRGATLADSVSARGSPGWATLAFAGVAGSAAPTAWHGHPAICPGQPLGMERSVFLGLRPWNTSCARDLP